MSAATHPLRLVAPWYRWWQFPGVAPRDTPPVLQKYETAGLVEMYLADPQRSLQFTDEDWVYETIVPAPAPGRAKVLDAGRLVRSDPPRRKLFLPSHKRFYLVACELHCDMPGFPNARRDTVCQVGMVVRRRRLVTPEQAAAEAERRVRRIARRSAQVAVLERRAVAHRIAVVGRGGGPDGVRAAYGRTLHGRRVRAAEALATEQRDLAAWAAASGARWALEGWFASDLDGVGEWAELDAERPAEVEEAALPLYPLVIPDARTGHAGRRRAIWFGLVPTGGADVDVTGAARFDDRMRYEVTCFVRRHEPRCPRTPASSRERDCHGEVVWSRPTEGFQLASHFDLVGTSNRPVTIQLPDIPTLRAQAASVPFGEGAPVRMQAPAGSSMRFGVQDGKPTNASLGDFQICSFAIPLITFVATFVFRLFLPIVVLIFGLFVLLRLRFCIPPSIGASAAVEAAFSKVAGGIDVDADASLRVTLSAELDDRIGGAYAGASGAGAQMTARYANGAIVRLQHEQGHELPPPPAPPAGAIPSPNGLVTLLWEKRVEVP